MMIISLAAVTSVDGKLTRHDDSHVEKWASKEDHRHFHSLIDDHPVLIMGSGTYEVMKPTFDLSQEKLRVTLTSHPETFEADKIKDKLEFVKADPASLVKQLEERGFETALIVGGTSIITEFLEAGLVDYFYWTVEPRLFGSGKPLTDGDLDITLNLEEIKQLNDSGTVLLKYSIPK